VFTFLLISSVYISIVDLASHKIRNRTLIVVGIGLSAITVIVNGKFYLLSALATLLFGSLAISCGLGAGDVKLATLLSLFFLPLEISRWSELCISFVVACVLLLFIHLVSRKSIAEPIALAPAICAAFIWCAR